MEQNDFPIDNERTSERCVHKTKQNCKRLFQNKLKTLKS